MNNVNIGNANFIISNKLKESYFNNTLISESKKVAFDFLDVVKNSPALQLEFKVFNSIENTHIESEMLAGKYIDEAIDTFQTFTIEEIDAERQKLYGFIQEEMFTELTEPNYNLEKVKLYDAIDTLITESLNAGVDADIDKIHESYALVLNHIKEPKKVLTEVADIDVELINENVLEIATDKFNEKYSTLIEEDKKLLQTLIKSTSEEKKNLLETYKNETLAILEGISDDNAKDGIAKAILKIKEMVYNQKEVDDHIIGLHELKKELL
jgi:hypothetical protein